MTSSELLLFLGSENSDTLTQFVFIFIVSLLDLSLPIYFEEF